MAGIKQTYSLVKSLSKAEKRMFKLQSGITGGEKDYLLLFNIIEKSTDEEHIKSTFLKQRSKSSFSITCNFLYHNIIKCLATSRNIRSVDDRMLEGLQEIKILYEKGLINDAISLVKTYKKLAKDKEKFLFFSLFSRLELDYNSQQQFHFLNEHEMLDSQSELKRALYQELNVMEHSSLYEILYLRYLKKGAVKSEQEKMQLNDLILSEMMLTENARYHSLEGKKIHSLFQSVYFMMTSDTKSSLRNFLELNTLLEERPELWGDPPFHYIYHLQGILKNLRSAGKYGEMKQFIHKLENIKTTSADTRLMIMQNCYIFEIQILIDLHHYKEALKVVKQYETKLLNKSSFLALADQAAISFFTALVFYLNHDFSMASHQLKMMYIDKNLTTLPVYRMMKLLNLFICYRKNDMSLLNYEMNSIRKLTNKEGKMFETERILMRFFKDLYKSNQKKKKPVIEKALHSLFLVSSREYEKTLLNYLDSRLLLKDLLAEL